MADLIERLAGNKAIANLVFGKLKKFIKEENITMICLYVDNENNIAAKQYEEPVVVLKQSDIQALQQYSDDLEKQIEQLKKQLPNGTT
jgi:hypothetical protein